MKRLKEESLKVGSDIFNRLCVASCFPSFHFFKFFFNPPSAHATPKATKYWFASASKKHSSFIIFKRFLRYPLVIKTKNTQLGFACLRWRYLSFAEKQLLTTFQTRLFIKRSLWRCFRVFKFKNHNLQQLFFYRGFF